MTQGTDTAPVLYSFRRCPYAMRARLALAVSGQACELREVVLRNKPQGLLHASPKGTVPVLVLPSGQVLEQSLDIVRWAFLETGDVDGWWARAQSAANLALLSACDGGFKHHLDRYKYPERFDGVDSKAHHREQAVDVLLRPLDAQLQSTSQLGGHAPCAADIAIFPFVRQFAAVDPTWFEALPLPALKGWLHGWLSTTLFNTAMTKLPANQTTTFPTA